jgi:hypothetical protein
VWDVEHEIYRLITQELRATTQFEGPLNVSGGVYYEHFSRPRFNAPIVLYVGLDPLVNNYTTTPLRQPPRVVSMVSRISGEAAAAGTEVCYQFWRRLPNPYGLGLGARCVEPMPVTTVLT